MTFGYDYWTLTTIPSDDCSAQALGWTPMAGALTQPKHNNDKLPAGDEIRVRGYAADLYGARACSFVSLSVLPPPTTSSTEDLVSSVLDSVAAGLTQGQGGAVQAISLLASMLNTATVDSSAATTPNIPSFNSGLLSPLAPPPPLAPPLVGAALVQQEQLREQMIGMLNDALPTTASSSSDKKAHAQVACGAGRM